jgi:hypothetical protein
MPSCQPHKEPRQAYNVAFLSILQEERLSIMRVSWWCHAGIMVVSCGYCADINGKVHVVNFPGLLVQLIVFGFSDTLPCSVWVQWYYTIVFGFSDRWLDLVFVVS